jgi:molybdopterin molybdotransferase
VNVIMASVEIDQGINYSGYREALELVRAHVHTVGVEEIPIAEGVGRVSAESITARVSNPSGDVSLKDGFAVKSSDIAEASPEKPVRLRIIGESFAGSAFGGEVRHGTAVSICSGSPIPDGADAVVSGEFCEDGASDVRVMADAEPGRNILRAGGDIEAGSIIVGKDSVLLPGLLGLTAAGGIERIRVYRRPRVALIAIGDEVVAPGGHLRTGQLYASNIVTTGAWLGAFGIPFTTGIVGDSREAIGKEIMKSLPGVDALITSGGAWGSERDLVAGVLEELGWQKVFHRVRMGPGKGIGFGILEEKPVFCLPGGPASNEMAFLQLALPGILRMAGQTGPSLPIVSARLTKDMKSRHRDWTEFRDAMLESDADGSITVTPYRERSRLQAIARAHCLVCIPEGVDSLHRGDTVPVQVLMPSFRGLTPTRERQRQI